MLWNATAVRITVAVTLAWALTSSALAQTMDYNLNQAVRSVKSITSSLQRLKPNDQNGAKRLAKKLDKATQLLDTSESSSHPEYEPTVQLVTALRQQLDQIMGHTTSQQAQQPAATTQPTITQQNQTMDYNLNQAIREIDKLSDRISRLQQNDVNGFNRLVAKLNKAAELMQASESKSHPDFNTTAQRWAALQQQLSQFGVAIQQTQGQQQNSEQTAKTQQSQVMDYNLNQAIRSIEGLYKQFAILRQNDISGFNRLSDRMNKAAELLQGSESRSHPEFIQAAQRLSHLQEQMAQIGAELRQEQDRQQKLLAQQQAKAAADAERERQEKAQAAAKLGEQRRLQENTTQTVLNPIKAKYERSSLPAISETPTPEQAREWATAMHALRTTELQTDVATIDAVTADGSANAEDARMAKYWITDGSQRVIASNIRDARMKAEGWVISAGTFADMVNAVEPGDKNGAYRFAKDDLGTYDRNLHHLDRALQAGEVILVYNDIFGEPAESQTEAINKIAAAREKLISLKPIADEQAVVIANAEPARPAKARDFLAPIAQKFWFEGNMIAESETDGSIWIDANDVADITNNGEIWIQANEMGSIEPNGEVWFDANHVGTLVDGGEVWRGGNQVGLIDKEGTAWVNGNPTGKIEPFDGEWRRAAIIYYFSDFFR